MGKRAESNLNKAITNACVRAYAKGVQPAMIISLLIGSVHGLLRQFGSDPETTAALIHHLADELREPPEANP